MKILSVWEMDEGDEDGVGGVEEVADVGVAVDKIILQILMTHIYPKKKSKVNLKILIIQIK